jgi:hypothetical protein
VQVGTSRGVDRVTGGALGTERAAITTYQHDHPSDLEETRVLTDQT